MSPADSLLCWGRESSSRIEIWRPSPGGATGGYFLLVLTTEYSGEHFWTRDLGTALQFAREMSGLVQAGALTEIAALFREQRDDSDALALGYKNRLARFAAEDRALDRALDARKEKAA